MSRSPLASTLLASVVLHLLGLTVLAFVWDSLWLSPPPSHLIDTELVTVSPPPAAPEPVSVSVSVPAPAPPPLPPSIAAAVPLPPAVSLPVQLPPPVPPPQVTPPPPSPPVEREIKRVEPLPQLPPPPKPPQVKAPPPVQPSRRPPAPPRVAEAKKAALPRRGPPSSFPEDAPAGARGNAAGPPATPQVDAPLPPGAGGEAGAGKLFDKGDAGVIPGPGSGGGGGGTARAGLGTGGEGAGNQLSSRLPGAGGAGGEGTGGSADSPARPLAGGYQVKPNYPDSARRRGIEGTTLLKIHVSEKGQVADVLVEQSAGHQDLDQAAVEAVKKWRFAPARKGNQPIAVWVKLPVRFELK